MKYEVHVKFFTWINIALKIGFVAVKTEMIKRSKFTTIF